MACQQERSPWQRYDRQDSRQIPVWSASTFSLIMTRQTAWFGSGESVGNLYNMVVGHDMTIGFNV